MNRVIVGFFLIPNFGPDSVEVPCTGNGPRDYANLDTAIRRKHGSAQPSGITRTGSIIEMRDEENAFVEVHEGSTLGQIFGPGNEGAGDGVEGESVRVIGTTFFSGSPFSIALIYLRAAGQIAIELRGRIHTDGNIRLPGRLNSQRLVSELPIHVRDMLGDDAKGTQLRLRIIDMKERV